MPQAAPQAGPGRRYGATADKSRGGMRKIGPTSPRPVQDHEEGCAVVEEPMLPHAHAQVWNVPPQETPAAPPQHVEIYSLWPTWPASRHEPIRSPRNLDAGATFGRRVRAAPRNATQPRVDGLQDAPSAPHARPRRHREQGQAARLYAWVRNPKVYGTRRGSRPPLTETEAADITPNRAEARRVRAARGRKRPGPRRHHPRSPVGPAPVAGERRLAAMDDHARTLFVAKRPSAATGSCTTSPVREDVPSAASSRGGSKLVERLDSASSTKIAETLPSWIHLKLGSRSTRAKSRAGRASAQPKFGSDDSPRIVTAGICLPQEVVPWPRRIARPRRK